MSDDATIAAIREATASLLKKFTLFHAQLCTKNPCPHDLREDYGKLDLALSSNSGREFLERLHKAEADVKTLTAKADQECSKRIASESRVKALTEENGKLLKLAKNR